MCLKSPERCCPPFMWLSCAQRWKYWQHHENGIFSERVNAQLDVGCLKMAAVFPPQPSNMMMLRPRPGLDSSGDGYCRARCTQHLSFGQWNGGSKRCIELTTHYFLVVQREYGRELCFIFKESHASPCIKVWSVSGVDVWQGTSSCVLVVFLWHLQIQQ